MDSSEKRKYNAEDDGDDPPEAKKRVIGPSLPPSAFIQPDDTSSDSGSDTESDDDFGPGLPPARGEAAASVESSNRPASPEVHGKKEEDQRDQWMLQPPGQSDWATKIDPTQIRNRKFQTGRSARSGTSKEVDARWVETPEERIRRLGDEVMGISAPSGVSKQPRTSDAARAKSMEERIKKFNDRTGKSSRLGNAEDVRKEDDDPSARAFDREKDMAISSKVSNAQRREMVDKASGYSSRFTKGDFL